MNWKYTDATKSSVFRVTSAGTESCLVDAIADWISEGNTPDPADLPPGPTPLEQIRALEAQYADAQAKLTRQVILSQALDKAMTYPEAAGLTRDQVHAGLMLANDGNTGYAVLFTLEQHVATLRAQL